MKVIITSEMPVRYDDTRYQKGDELTIKKEHFNENIMKEVEVKKASAGNKKEAE